MKLSTLSSYGGSYAPSPDAANVGLFLESYLGADGGIYGTSTNRLQEEKCPFPELHWPTEM